MKQGQGNFINGSFINEGSITLTSENPSHGFAPVFSVKTDIHHVPKAIEAAKKAYNSWSYLPQDARIKCLQSLKQAFIHRETLIAEAISLEMGKLHHEALTEAKSLSARIDLMIEHGLKRVATESLYDLRACTRYHSQGVLAVIGPFNFPAHLVNAHVIPSILLGNTVVIKPSEICPMVAEIYAECVKASEIPTGVVNIIHGHAEIGRALCAHQDIDGVLFTGSYPTGRALKELLLHQPHKILVLEMGGKNFAVVMDDADLHQAVLEIVLGAYLTTGQRCTATSRVLVHKNVFDKFKKMLMKIVANLKPCGSLEKGLFGPLATKRAQDRFITILDRAKNLGAQVLIDSYTLPGGAFITPSVYQISNTHPLDAYLTEELFGPNICLEEFSDLDQAIQRINQSPYGLSNAIFTLDKKNCEQLFNQTKSGVLNINRSTNNAFGQMPFGGLNKSGNQRPAGIDAVRYATFPVAITSLPYGETQAPAELVAQIKNSDDDHVDVKMLAKRHEVEICFETYGAFCDNAALDTIYFSRESLAPLNEQFFVGLKNILKDNVNIDDKFVTVKTSRIDQESINQLDDLFAEHLGGCALNLRRDKALSINIPNNLELPRSRAMLDRLYRHKLVPAEKKAPVADLDQSCGPFLASVDDHPLVILDAASQIATMGAGFLADTFQNAYDTNEFDLALLANCDLSSKPQDETSPFFIDATLAKNNFENFLREKSHQRFSSISYGASGAEANEIAFDLCRLNGGQGTRIIAFVGAFHGRTILSLQATYNREKRGPFVFAGYEASFIDFPELKDPKNQPAYPADFLKLLSEGKIPTYPDADKLLEAELNSLSQVKQEIEQGNVCAVIIEPMQCEGGDRYASNRFFSGLRALTRALKIPLIFDEVQTGFNLGREFFWYQALDLRDHKGNPEIPDCVTLAKKAQLGVCLSIWPYPRINTPHVLQLKRGLLHALAIKGEKAAELEEQALKELKRLQDYFPRLVKNVRASGFAFAFDMPTKELASELIDQRFFRGFMAYIAGEKTLRFRLNMTISDDLLKTLFEKLFIALIDIRDRQTSNVVKIKHIGPVSKPARKVIKFITLSLENFADYEQDVNQIETEAYELGRRDSMDTLRGWLKQPDSVGILMLAMVEEKEVIAGYAIGGPLEHATIDGPKYDVHRDKHNTFYSANIAVNKDLRGLGLGKAIKREQLKRVIAIKNQDGSPRYLFMTGRNRVGHTLAMSQINKNLGAYVVDIYHHQYGDPNAQAAYYRLPINKAKHEDKIPPKSKAIDCRNSLEMPFVNLPDSLLSTFHKNRLRSLLGSKLTLSNWATPNIVRYSELLRAFMPKDLKHCYFTSGRGEVLDKGLRSLRFHRPDADIAIGFSHQWFGLTTAAARSLSHDQNQMQPCTFFNWPKIAHPHVVGCEKSLNELNTVLSKHPPEKILGIVIELLGEYSAFSFDHDFLSRMDIIAKKSGIPVVFVENASAFGRFGRGLFLTDSLPIKPNMVLWYTGGQLGHIFVDDEYFVDKPLTLISTWDGDEVSMVRAYHHLLQGFQNSEKNIQYFSEHLASLSLPYELVGQGSWHALRINDEDILKKAINWAQKHGVLFGEGFDYSLMICPKPDLDKDQFSKVCDVLRNCFNSL